MAESDPTATTTSADPAQAPTSVVVSDTTGDATLPNPTNAHMAAVDISASAPDATVAPVIDATSNPHAVATDGSHDNQFQPVAVEANPATTSSEVEQVDSLPVVLATIPASTPTPETSLPENVVTATDLQLPGFPDTNAKDNLLLHVPSLSQLNQQQAAANENPTNTAVEVVEAPTEMNAVPVAVATDQPVVTLPPSPPPPVAVSTVDDSTFSDPSFVADYTTVHVAHSDSKLSSRTIAMPPLDRILSDRFLPAIMHGPPLAIDTPYLFSIRLGAPVDPGALLNDLYASPADDESLTLGNACDGQQDLFCIWRNETRTCEHTHAKFDCDVPLAVQYLPPAPGSTDSPESAAAGFIPLVHAAPQCSEGFCCDTRTPEKVEDTQWLHQHFIPSSSAAFRTVPTPRRSRNHDAASIKRERESPYPSCIFYPYRRLDCLQCLQHKRIVITGDSMMREFFRRFVGVVREEKYVVDYQWHSEMRLRVTEQWDAVSYHPEGDLEKFQLSELMPHPSLRNPHPDTVYDIIFLFWPQWYTIDFEVLHHLRPNILIQSIQLWEGDESWGRDVGRMDAPEYREKLLKYVRDPHNEVEHFFWVGSEAVSPITKYAPQRNKLYREWIETNFQEPIFVEKKMKFDPRAKFAAADGMSAAIEQSLPQAYGRGHFIDAQLLVTSAERAFQWTKPHSPRHFQCEASYERDPSDHTKCFDAINYNMVQMILNTVCNQREGEDNVRSKNDEK